MSASPADDRPIGVFDSGVGGLTVLHECLVSLPAENFLYLGDSAWFPYGIKPGDRLRERARRIAAVLLERGAKLLVIACNSATTAGADAVRQEAARAGVHVVTVIEPEAEIAAAITESGRIGVLATPTTVEGGAYHAALARQGRGLDVTEVAAPDLAPIIQHGFPFDDSVVNTVRSYCAPLRRAEVDTLILGCTHYPLIAPMLQRILGRDVRLVTAGHAVAAAVQRTLEAEGLARAAGGEGDYRFLCTGDVAAFAELGTRFLQMPLGGRVEPVRVDGPTPPVEARALATVPGMADSVIERVRTDAQTAMKAGDRERAGSLRLVLDALQQDAKLGKGDEVAVLQRERKKRLEAAEAYRGAGRDEQAASESREAELIENYMPAQLSDEELDSLVAAAVEEAGATEQRQIGQVMSILMPKVGGRADGKRVSGAVRERLGA